LSYYIDPDSTKVIELGTKSYPYRSVAPATSDMINRFSYSDVNITIYLKEGTRVYLEDDTAVFLQITSVTFTTYSSTSSSPGKALIVPTAVTQNSLFDKTLFRIFESTDINVNAKIEEGNIDATNKGKLSETLVTFKVFRTNFSLINVDVYRENVDIDLGTMLYSPIDLQNRNFTISKSLDFLLSQPQVNMKFCCKLLWNFY
jgi:hypothetical protein